MLVNNRYDGGYSIALSDFFRLHLIDNDIYLIKIDGNNRPDRSEYIKEKFWVYFEYILKNRKL